MLLGELRGEQKEHEERNDVKWNRLNEKLYIRLLDVNANGRKENRIYVFILRFIYLLCALRHNILAVETKCSVEPCYYFHHCFACSMIHEISTNSVKTSFLPYSSVGSQNREKVYLARF